MEKQMILIKMTSSLIDTSIIFTYLDVHWFAEYSMIQYPNKDRSVFHLIIMSTEFRTVPAEVRQSYLDDVNSITPYDEQEAKEIIETMAWLRSSPALNKPDNLDQHLGVLSILLSPEKDRTYLLDHKKARLWLPPGGHVDFGRRLADTASEELTEELGISDPQLLKQGPVFLSRTLTQGSNAGHIDLTTWFVFEGNPTTRFTLQEKEALSGAWIKTQDLLSDPKHVSLHRGFHKLLSFLG